jgi:hypothetical protein
MKSDIVYQDSLLEISDDKIVFKKYYFPTFKSKEVAIGNIAQVQVKEPSLTTGKYRYHGTGNIRTWYPLDMARSTRDKIFFLILKDQWVRIGFTGENSEAIENFFRQKGLLS